MRVRLFLLAGALAAFGASLGSGFHFDDYAIFAGPLRIFDLHQTRPLTYLTFWLNRQIGGDDPVGYHAVNLLLHLGAILLVYECLRRLLPERAAWLAAGLFAIHPIQAEAVNYVWARSILLASVLCFAALLAWLEGRQWLAVGVFAAALLAKEECAAFPILLWVLQKRKTLRPGRLSHYTAMLSLSLAAGIRVMYATVVTPGAHAGVQAGISPLNYLAAQSVVILRYLQLLILPYGFTVDPDVHVSLGLGAVAWTGLIAAAVWAWRRGQIWFVGGLALLMPSSSIFPAADLAADRRMYLPMLAFGATGGLLLTRLRTQWIPSAVGVALVVLSVVRTSVWMSDVWLWREAVERAPGKVRPKVQLARALPAAQALALLNQARALAPYDPAIAAETGKVLLAEGQPEAALEEFGRALALAPADARNLNNRGVALHALRQTEAARQDFLRALQLDPNFNEARENLAKISPPAP